MAGRVLIEAVGKKGVSLTDTPSFSFFTTRYSKYTNYANETVKMTFPEKVYTDDFLEVVIPQKYGDILTGVTLSFVAEPEGANVYPVDVFGISVIDYVELFVGDQKIDTVTGDDIFIDRELHVPESYRSSVDAIHGKAFQGSGDPEFVQEFFDGQYNTQGIDPFSTGEYRIQIPFYFHRRPGRGFPMCAVYAQELTLRIKLRPAMDVVFTTQEKFGSTLWDPGANNRMVHQFELSQFTVNLDVVFLNAPERYRIQFTPLDIVYDQNQRNVFMIEPQSKTGTFKLEFTNCVKELYFIAKKFGHWTQDQIAILNQLHELDRLTPSQVNVLNILKQSIFTIQIWEEIIRVGVGTLEGETNQDIRDSTVDVLLQSILWGPDQVQLLEALKDPESSTEGVAAALIQYLNTIPAQILTIQTTATQALLALPGQTDPNVRDTFVNTLLAIPNVWGTVQIRLLEALRDPAITGTEEEALLITQLRVFLTQISYFLTGLDTLPPGSAQQLNTITNLFFALDAIQIQSDILKLGMLAVLNTLPGKVRAVRNVIVDGLLRVGEAIWQETQIQLLEQLRDQNIDLTAQSGIISGLAAFLTGTYDGTVTLQNNVIGALGTLPGQTDGSIRVATIDPLIAIPNVWGTEQVQLLEALKDPNITNTETETNIILQLSIFVAALAIGVHTLNEGISTELGEFPDGTLAERVARVEVLRQFPVWRDETITLLITLSALVPGTPGREQFIEGLELYMQGLIGGIPSLVFTLNLFKGGVNGILDTLPATAQERDPIIIGLLSLGVWGPEQFALLTQLRIPSGEDQNRIDALRALSTNISIMDGISQSRQNETIQVLATRNIWGEQFFTLNQLRLVTPGFIGESAIIASLTAYLAFVPDMNLIYAILDTLPTTTEERTPIIYGLLALGIWGQDQIAILNQLLVPSVNDDPGRIAALKAFVPVTDTYLIDGIDATLDALPATTEERAPIIYGLLALGIWGQDQIAILNQLLIPSVDDDPGRIAALKGFITGTINVLEGAITTLGTSAPDVDNLIALGIWGVDQISLLEDLHVATTVAVQNSIKQQLIQYVNGILFNINTVNDGIEATLASVPTVTDVIDRSILIAVLLQFPIWGPDQVALMNGELRTVGSQDHAAIVDSLVSYLGTLSTTAGGVLTQLGLLDTGDHTTIVNGLLQDTAATDTVWGGYIIRILGELSIESGSEAVIIQKLQGFVTSTFFTATMNQNIQFLFTQLTVRYPEPVFNKWVLAKKHVPLMYSKQRTTTLTCDGTKIIDETTGNNLFLSISLPNMYHKRSPIFRNINMYSFALNPRELEPSGHLNFSTVKDAYLTMELEYDGSHGTFDFDDNFIDILGVPRIDFPKQVIVIARSYNVMKICNGRCTIMF
jgi:hypothetical protein